LGLQRKVGLHHTLKSLHFFSFSLCTDCIVSQYGNCCNFNQPSLKIPYSDDWYVYLVFFEQLNVYAAIEYGGDGSQAMTCVCCMYPVDVEIWYFDKIDLPLAYTRFNNTGPF
jgi:hypothetical protein